MTKKKDRKKLRRRILTIWGLFMMLFSAAIAKSVNLQVTERENLQKRAERQYSKTVSVSPQRGSIRDRNGQILSQSVDMESLYARPSEISRDEGSDARIAGVLGVARNDVRNRLKRKRSFVWIQRQIVPSRVEKLRDLGLEGMGFLTEKRRFYPQMSLAGHILGFVGVDSQGLEGIERQFDGVLKGSPRSLHVERDARGRGILVEEREGNQGSKDVVLTIDKDIQYVLEKELKDGVEGSRAKGGVAVAMDPMSGEILGLAVAPQFNPNVFSRYSPESWKNRAITDAYEPGSTFKVFLLAAALEAGVADTNDIFFCENGAYVVGENIIKDDERKYGWLSLKQIMKVSSNIGASKVGEALGRDRFYRYIKAFGFGEAAGVELPGESKGQVRPVRTWPKVSLRTISFGQGVSVTPLQMVTALSSIANGGFLMKPHILKRIIDNNGSVLFDNGPVVVRRVISAETAQKAIRVLKSVVEEGGTGERAHVPGYTVAGKTGTAQKPDTINGGYSREKHVASFMGFFPAETPRIVLFVMLDEPRTSPYGGVVAAPIFRRIVEKLVIMLDIPPARNMAEKGPGTLRRG